MSRRKICDFSRNIIWNVFETLKSNVFNLFNLSKRSNNVVDESSNSETNQEKDNRPIMIIPSGTQLCPTKRHDFDENINPAETFYITINKSIEVRLDTSFTVMINGASFNVIDSNSKNKTNTRNDVFHSVVIPKNTPYYVSDAKKDSIGLTHLLKTDERFRIRPGSYVYLLDGTDLLLGDKKEFLEKYQSDIMFLDGVHVMLKGKTKCVV